MSAILAFFYYLFLPMFSIVLTFVWVKKAKSRHHTRVVKLVCAIWFLWLTWNLVGGEKILMDREVDRLCAKDGGIKVYETVVLPSERFDKCGVFYLPIEKKFTPEDEYYYARATHYYQNKEPSMRKAHSRVFRKSDGKLLGETTWYLRRGGDLPGPGNSSSYSCPTEAGISQLKKKIFTQISNCDFPGKYNEHRQ